MRKCDCGGYIVTEINMFNQQYISGWLITCPVIPTYITVCINCRKHHPEVVK